MPATGVKAWSVFGEIGLAGMPASMGKLKAFDAAGKKAGLSVLGLQGGALAAAAGVTVLAGAAAMFTVSSIKAFGDFDEAMTSSLAIMGDVSDSMRSEMAVAARAVAKETQFSAKQAADAYFFLASAGLDAVQSVAAMPQVAKFAQAGNFDLARATDLLTDAQSALGLTVKDATRNLANMARVSDVLVKANTLANASVEQFSESLTNKAGARLRILNKDIEEGVAVLAAYADQGVKGSLAGERLNIVLRDLPDQAVKTSEAFERLGIAVFDDADNVRHTADILADFEKVLAGTSDATKVMTFQQLGLNKRVADGLVSLIGMSQRIKDYEASLKEAGGTTDEVATKQMDTLNKKVGILGDTFKDLKISLGEVVAPDVIEFIENLTEALENLHRVASFMSRSGVRLSQLFSMQGQGEMIISLLRHTSELQHDYRAVSSAFEEMGLSMEAGLASAQREGEGLHQTFDRLLGQSEDFDAFIEKLREMAEQAAGPGPIVFPPPDAPVPPEVKERIAGRESDRARIEREQQEALQAEALTFARERAIIEENLGIRTQQQKIARLREELEAEKVGSDERLQIYQQLAQAELQLRVDREELDKQFAERRKAIAKKEFEDRARYGEQWLQLQVEQGNISLENYRQIVEIRLQMARALHAGTMQEIQLTRELNSVNAELTDQTIQRAQAMAAENKAAAVQVLVDWMASLQAVGQLTEEVLEKVRAALVQIGKTGKDAGANFEAAYFAVGRQIGMGLVSGVLSVKSILLTAFSFLLNAGLSHIGGLMGFGSPSKVMAKRGVWMGEGLAMGIESTAPMVKAALGSLVDGSVLGDALTQQLDVASTEIQQATRAMAAEEGNAFTRQLEGASENIRKALKAMAFQPTGYTPFAQQINQIMEDLYAARAAGGMPGGQRTFRTALLNYERTQQQQQTEPEPTVVKFDFSGMPAARSPMESTRDAKWQEFLRESLLEAESGGFRAIRRRAE